MTTNKLTKLIMLDRDGVINKDLIGEYVKTPEEWTPIPGSLEAIAKLNQAGYTVVIVTNQSGLGRGYFDHATLEKIHAKMHQALQQVGGKIEKVYFCPHRPEENCECRKPKIGMLKQIEKDFSIDLHQTYYIGDKYIDYLTAKNACCPFILVSTGYGDSELKKHPELESVTHAKNLSEAADIVLL